MSRRTITRYRDLAAERRREEQREIQRLRKELQRCIQLEQDLAALEDVRPGEYSQMLARLDATQDSIGQPSSSTERRQWLGRLPMDAENIERAIAAAQERRIQLEFAARSLIRGADSETRRTLEDCARRARRANRADFVNFKRVVEGVVTNLILEKRPTIGQSQSEESLKLAAALMNSVSNTQQQAPLPENHTQLKMNKLITAIAALGVEAGNLLVRAQELLSAEHERGFDLKLDSLMIEASELSVSVRSRKEVLAEIEVAEEALAPFDDPTSAALKMSLVGLKSTRSLQGARTIIADAHKHADKTAAKQDAERARSALLEGLQELGYEVHLQGDVWAQGERITVQKPDEPNYDVQLAAAADGRVQSKVRAYSHSGRSPGMNERDSEMEGSWCADLVSLNELLKVAGIEARLDHEDAPGTAVQIPIERRSTEPARATLSPRTRSTPRS